MVGTGIWTRDLPNASLVRYHGATSLGTNEIVHVTKKKNHLSEKIRNGLSFENVIDVTPYTKIAENLSFFLINYSSHNIKFDLSEHFLLSSDIRSEGGIAIVKKFDFDFFMIFGSTSLPQSKNVF